MTASRTPVTATEKLFRIAIVLKGLDGGLQLIAGILLLFIPPRAITELAELVTRDLFSDPAGRLAIHLHTAAQDFASGSTHWFVITYLLLHAVIKIGLVVALLRKIMPAYPVAALALAAFVVFE